MLVKEKRRPRDPRAYLDEIGIFKHTYGDSL